MRGAGVDKQPEVDDLSDWLDDANRTVFAEAEWDETIEFQIPDTRPHEVSEDDIEVLADSEGIRSWRHGTGQWRAIT